MTADSCSVCDDLRWVIVEFEHWRVALNRNQALPGKVMVALRRHHTDALTIRRGERDELWSIVAPSLRLAIERGLGAVHFNYMFLMNQDAHVHLHIVPRYDRATTIAGLEFVPTSSLDPPPREPPDAVMEAIGEVIVRSLPPVGARQLTSIGRDSSRAHSEREPS